MLKKTIFIICLLFTCGLTLVNTDWFWDVISPLCYEDVVYKYARKYDIDPFLAAAMIKVESSFYSAAQSPKGAIGLMQIMPSTAKEIASKLNLRPFCISELYDPEVNIQIGLYYFVKLKNEFNGDIYLSLAAYNGGLKNVKKWIKQKKITLQNSKKEIKNIPFKETRQFVHDVIGNYHWLKITHKIRNLLHLKFCNRSLR